MAVRTTPSKPRVSLDRTIERMRKQLAEFAPFLGRGKPTCSLEEFDLETERLITTCRKAIAGYFTVPPPVMC